jgi:tripartite ATP-independent transporter DctM subunit
MILVFAISFVFLLLVAAPIVVALGGCSLVYALVSGNIPLTTLVQTTFGGLASFPLLAVPLFILAGNLMNAGGITPDLVRFTRLLLGHVRGGLGLATILACAVFAAISGAAVATAVAIGVVMIPAMKQAGYDDDISAALTCVASCMGPIIPPSIPFIIYGVSAGVSIAALFLGGVFPGLLLGLGLMVYMYVVASRKSYPRDPRPTVKEIARAGWRAFPALFMPLVIMGGILTGAFTPTEAAGVAVVYATFVGSLVYRRLKLKDMPDVLLKSGLESGMVMLLIAMSEPFAWIVAADQIPQLLLEWMSGITTSPYLILLLVNIFLLILGIPIETAPALVIVTPILAPLATAFGIDPVHLGIIICLNLVLGLITPPVGAVLFAVCGVAKISMDSLARAIWPPFLVALAVLGLVTYIPWLSTFLPKLFMGSQ